LPTPPRRRSRRCRRRPRRARGAGAGPPARHRARAAVWLRSRSFHWYRRPPPAGVHARAALDGCLAACG
jgi:hypothetical protein